MKVRNLLILVLLFCILASMACNPFGKEIVLDSWKPDIAIPLFQSSVSVDDLLDGIDELAEVQIDPDNVIRLIYKSEYYEVDSDDLLSLIPSNTFVLWDTVRNYVLSNANNIRVDKIRVKSGSLFYQIGWFGGGTVDVTLTVPQATLNGEVFEELIVVNGFLTQGHIDLTEYELQPNNDTVTFKYHAVKRNSGEVIVFDNTFALQFTDVKTSYLEGYLGTSTYVVPRDSVFIDFFDFFVGGSAFFENPIVEVTVNNSMGFPVRASVELLQAVKKDGSIIPIGNLALEEGIDFNYPLLNEVGQSKSTRFIFDAGNSNVEDIIGQPIELVDYKVIPWANPDGDTSITGFLTDSSRIGFEVRVELPFFGTVNGFTVQDTFDFDIRDLDEVDYADFKLITENGFPFDVSAQAFFLDENDLILDSLFATPENIMIAASIDDNREVSSPAIKETFARIDSDRLGKIRRDATKMIIRTGLTSLSGGQISLPVLSTYTFNYRMGLIAGVYPE